MSVLLALLQTRQLLVGLPPLEAGVWFTLLSLLSWISFFELGVGNGLKNQLIAVLAQGDKLSARELVSAAYGGLLMVLFPIVALLCLSTWVLPLGQIFNAEGVSASALQGGVLLALVAVFVNLYVGLGGQIAAALGWPLLQFLAQFLAQLFFVGIVYWQKRDGQVMSIPGVAWAYLIGQLVGQSVVSLWVFLQAPYLRPAGHFTRKVFKRVMGLAYQFALLQLAVFLTFNVGNLVIAHYISPAEVRVYAAVAQYFGLTSIILAAVGNTLWPALASALSRNDRPWLEKTVRRAFMLFGLLVLVAFLQWIFARPIMNLWLAKQIDPSRAFLAMSAVATVICVWNQLLSVMLNASSQLAGQLVTAIYGMIVTGPAIILFIHLGWGLSAVPAGIIAGIIPFSFYGFSKLRKLQYI
jgi:O-antigen/teichoic acid export membrane protein